MSLLNWTRDAIRGFTNYLDTSFYCAAEHRIGMKVVKGGTPNERCDLERVGSHIAKVGFVAAVRLHRGQ
jgi:hypothetical protein